ncbi:MAG TPA: class I SAM-dependent methyltransferase [Pyrinomonadaceae bacterium]|jgi:ubiquinone/menaquinone biosynthesis C-methylase UbiE|nr:class I SAM-dependent methyltransferase [Acidobacteriota bacterium]HQZ98002.1 class I SAM-dependent methyltransferase [Pyrinomonadaceae bacterium]
MKLNSIEKFLMNNPVRAFIQRHHEARMFEKFGGKTTGQIVLEIGCGRGVGSQIILERFGAGEVHAFDLDPKMIGLARNRLAKFPAEKLQLYVGDAEGIDAPDNSYDAVFDFGIIHHAPLWQNAVSEVARVLKPGGKFYFEEVTRKALDSWSYRTFLKHPTEDRFSGPEFIRELETNGVNVGDNHTYWLFSDLVLGVGTKGE